MDEIVERKKKKKKKKGYFLIPIIILLGLFYFEFSDVYEDPTLSSFDKIIITLILVITLGLGIAFTLIKGSIRRVIVACTSVTFTNIIFPMLLFILILMGALETKYPQIQYPNGTFSENINKSFGIVGGAVEKAAVKVTMILYDIGKSHPNIWIMVMVLFIMLGVWRLKSDIKEAIMGEMDAQELIDSINDKDYKDLEKYERYKL